MWPAGARTMSRIFLLAGQVIEVDHQLKVGIVDRVDQREPFGRGVDDVGFLPLRRQETNIINSASEGLKLVNAIDDPNFQLMIDFYHLASEREDPDIVLRAGSSPGPSAHGESAGPCVPARMGANTDYAPFFANLRKAGYDKRISIEASATDFRAEAPRAISRCCAGPSPRRHSQG